MIVEEYSLRPDSGGAGAHRGGLGVRSTVRVLGDMTLNSRIERTHCAPWGLFGGPHGAAELHRCPAPGRPGARTFANGKVSAPS